MVPSGKVSTDATWGTDTEDEDADAMVVTGTLGNQSKQPGVVLLDLGMGWFRSGGGWVVKHGGDREEERVGKVLLLLYEGNAGAGERFGF